MDFFGASIEKECSCTTCNALTFFRRLFYFYGDKTLLVIFITHDGHFADTVRGLAVMADLGILSASHDG